MDINKSGTRKEDLLIEKNDLNRLWILRKVLAPMNVVDAMDFLLGKIEGVKTNTQFLSAMSGGGSSTALSLNRFVPNIIPKPGLKVAGEGEKPIDHTAQEYRYCGLNTHHR